MLTINGSNPIIPAAHISYDNKGGVPIFHSCYLAKYTGESWNGSTWKGIQNHDPNYIIVAPGFKVILYEHYFYNSGSSGWGNSQTIDNRNGKDARYVECTRSDFSSIRVFYNKNGTETEIVHDPAILTTSSNSERISRTGNLSNVGAATQVLS